MKRTVLGKKLLFWLGKGWLQLLYCGRPVPIDRLLSLRSFSSDENALSPKLENVASTGENLRDPLLANWLMNTGLGRWSLAASTLNYLERQLWIHKPKVILEFGSGVSTACLAHYMKELHGDSKRAYVISVEQEWEFVEKTEQFLKTLRLDRYVRVFYAPLQQQLIERIPINCYDLSAGSLRSVLADSPPDFVIIDGPAAEPGARFGTLPLVRPFLSPGAWFFLDDALRDGELKVAQLWRQLRDVRVEGVYFVGKGLLVGQVC